MLLIAGISDLCFFFFNPSAKKHRRAFEKKECFTSTEGLRLPESSDGAMIDEVINDQDILAMELFPDAIIFQSGPSAKKGRQVPPLRELLLE